MPPQFADVSFLGAGESKPLNPEKVRVRSNGRHCVCWRISFALSRSNHRSFSRSPRRTSSANNRIALPCATHEPSDEIVSLDFVTRSAQQLSHACQGRGDRLPAHSIKEYPLAIWIIKSSNLRFRHGGRFKNRRARFQFSRHAHLVADSIILDRFPRYEMLNACVGNPCRHRQT